MGLREYAGSGINVIGTYEESNGLQHYKLKTGQEKKLVYKKAIN